MKSESGELYLLHEDRERQSADGCQTYLERKRYWFVSRYLHRGLV
jgi:hypothetical protein